MTGGVRAVCPINGDSAGYRYKYMIRVAIEMCNVSVVWCCVAIGIRHSVLATCYISLYHF